MKSYPVKDNYIGSAVRHTDIQAKILDYKDQITKNIIIMSRVRMGMTTYWITDQQILLPYKVINLVYKIVWYKYMIYFYDTPSFHLKI